jgi:hypothetical protein
MTLSAQDLEAGDSPHYAEHGYVRDSCKFINDRTASFCLEGLSDDCLTEVSTCPLSCLRFDVTPQPVGNRLTTVPVKTFAKVNNKFTRLE